MKTKSNNYEKLLKRVSGKSDCKSFWFPKQGVALTQNGWLRKDGFSYLPINESHSAVISARLHYNLGNYRFKRDDNESFRETYKMNMAKEMRKFYLEHAKRRIFKSIKGTLDLDKIKAILEYQKLEPDNTYCCRVDNEYSIVSIGNFNNEETIPCIETRHLVKCGEVISNKFSLGRVHGYTDVTTL